MAKKVTFFYFAHVTWKDHKGKEGQEVAGNIFLTSEEAKEDIERIKQNLRDECSDYFHPPPEFIHWGVYMTAFTRDEPNLDLEAELDKKEEEEDDRQQR